MGREVRRVPLDFDWPIGSTWHGYTQPSPKRPCPDPDCCHGSSPEGAMLDIFAHMIAIPAEEGSRPRHPWIDSMVRHLTNIPPVTRWNELTAALAGRKAGSFGHDACDGWSIGRKIREAAGLPESWAMCKTCGGERYHPDDVNLAEPKPFDPPAGDGWQMWETTSEGSPISPVFNTPERLARWLADTGASTFGRSTAPYETWLAMIVGTGWAPSMMSTGGCLMSGVEGVAGS